MFPALILYLLFTLLSVLGAYWIGAKQRRRAMIAPKTEKKSSVLADHHRLAVKQRLGSRQGLTEDEPALNKIAHQRQARRRIVKDTLALIGEARGGTAPAQASYVPMFAHLALVLGAGVYLPPPLVVWFQNVAGVLG